MCLIFSCHISNYMAKKAISSFKNICFCTNFFPFLNIKTRPKTYIGFQKKKKTLFSDLHMQVSVTYIKYCKNLIYDYDQIQVIIIPIMNSIHLFL